MRPRFSWWVLSFLGAGWSAGVAMADVKLPALFSNGMVLQRDAKIPVWGWADDGEKVTVKFQGAETSATAEGGKWKVELPAQKAGGPYTLSVSGKNNVEIGDVLVGEVWICSGQSNMQWSVRSSEGADEAIKNSTNPMLRLFSVPHVTADTPQEDVKGNWSASAPNTVANFTAVGYYFGKEIQETQKIPVGLINTSWGGTPAQSWTPKPVVETKHPEIVLAYQKAMAAYPKLKEINDAKVAEWKKTAKKGDKLPRELREPMGPKSGDCYGSLYNAMIAPLQPYAIRGAIWYQGEANAGNPKQYAELFPNMIQAWRETWKQGDFPFYFVQLAPFGPGKPKDEGWGAIREAQRQTLEKSPNTAMAVITDVGDEHDIHPVKKAPVGHRLALAARALVHGEQIEYSGPEPSSVSVDGNKAIIRFDHLGGGLVVKGDKLVGFKVAGSDGKFVDADASVVGDTVVVSSAGVEKPVTVRFGWQNVPDVNLWNKADLPATPFEIKAGQ